jgi:hypothetical protein
LNEAKPCSASKKQGNGTPGVSAWRVETSTDLDDARRRLEEAVSSVSGEPTKDQLNSVWKAYVDVEKSIVFIRVEIDEENPGRFFDIRKYAIPDERQALQFALKNLRKGSDSFQLGDFVRSLRELREARNYLRALLRAKQLQRVRMAKLKS